MYEALSYLRGLKLLGYLAHTGGAEEEAVGWALSLPSLRVRVGQRVVVEATRLRVLVSAARILVRAGRGLGRSYELERFT